MKRSAASRHYGTGSTNLRIDWMDHKQAIEQKAAERYLLNELAPDARDAFEEHLFDCPACAVDVRAGAAFVDEARLQLPGLTTTSPLRTASAPARPRVSGWFSAWRPVFVVPAFAALLLVAGYQNLVTFPALRATANQPRLVPVVPIHQATRGASRIMVAADRRHGIALPLDLGAEPGSPSFASYAFELHDAQQRLSWTGTAAAPAENGELMLSLEIPGAALSNGACSLSVFGVNAHGERTAIERYSFDVQMTD